MANLVEPAALLVLILSLSGSVSNAAPTELILDNHPSFRDETVRDWCVLLTNGTVIPNAPELYLWPVRKEAVGWYQCPSTVVDTDAVDTTVVITATTASEKQSQKGLQAMDAWWPYPPPHQKPGLKTWTLFRSWPQTHLRVFPNWQTHQPVTAGSITEEGLKLEQKRRLRRPWLSSGSEWENDWQLPLPAPAVFGVGDEDGEEQEGDLVFGLPLSDGNENESEKQLSKNKREVVRRWSQGSLEEIPHGSQEEEEHKPNVVDRWEDGDGKTESANPTSNNHTQAEEVEENSAEEHHHHHHHHHHHEEIKENTAAGENAKGHEGHEGHDHHGPMCDWSFWEPVIGVLVVLAGLWWFLVRRGRAGFGGLSPGFTVHKPAWVSSLGRGFRKEKWGGDVEEGQAMLTV